MSEYSPSNTGLDLSLYDFEILLRTGLAICPEWNRFQTYVVTKRGPIPIFINQAADTTGFYLKTLPEGIKPLDYENGRKIHELATLRCLEQVLEEDGLDDAPICSHCNR